MPLISNSYPAAVLVLADGSFFHGHSIGYHGTTTAEIVFNTSMTGYQEMLTDPSYCGQIIALTAPHIGNVGTNSNDEEAKRIWAAGLVIRDTTLITSNFRHTQTLSEYLEAHKIVAIANIDTRRLTRHLREFGSQNAHIFTLAQAGLSISAEHIALAQKAANAAPVMDGQDLAKVVSVQQPYVWHDANQANSNLCGSWDPRTQNYRSAPAPQYKIVAYDFGIKRNILRTLATKGCTVTVVPAQTSAQQVLAMNPDGVFFSNGPGDPAACDYAIDAAQEFLTQKIPLFGICLGHQIIALASGARTLKMKFGHHGGNHPVQDVKSGRVYITAQNHGFAVDTQTLPPHCELSHISLFDRTCQGFVRTDTPAMGFQGHPEASPGPAEIDVLFDQFISLIKSYRRTTTHPA